MSKASKCWPPNSTAPKLFAYLRYDPDVTADGQRAVAHLRSRLHLRGTLT